MTMLKLTRPLPVHGILHHQTFLRSQSLLLNSLGKSTLRTITTTAHPGPAASFAFTRSSGTRFPSLWKAIGLTGIGLGASIALSPTVFCEPTPPPKSEPASSSPPPGVYNSKPPPPPESAVNLYELSFGTVAGICAGVFVKKGAKAIAFFLGGVFVLLQYLGQTSIIRVDWGAVGKRFENLFYTTDANGARKAPTVYSLFSWLVDFLTADFQPRASFLAGLMLGLRIG
ncbi:hypothetical protein VNI00_003473 [Paramarasmius palmivorus]|uniref:FUN14 family protein n=1 Tax=Paramarasmius palmivorus TaxID=297713 RepID=A0AAW0DS73_9AGAR